MINTRNALATAVALTLVVGCGSAANRPNPGVGQPAWLDHVRLSPDGSSVEVVVLGAAPLSAGGPCGADFELASSAFNGAVLQVLVKQTAERRGTCAPTELACCEHVFSTPLPPGQPVDRVRDLGDANHVRELIVGPPHGLYQLPGLPSGWELQRDWAEPGGTWVRVYSPDTDPPPWSRETLIFRTVFGGGIFTDSIAVQSPAMVNGVEALYQRYPDYDNQITLQWLVDGQALTLHTYEETFSIDQLVVFAEGATL